MWTVHCDASAPDLAIGAVLISPEGERHTFAERLNRRGDSNEAEALAFIAALERVLALGGRRARVFVDNSVLIDELTGGKRTKTRLASVYDAARDTVAKLDSVSLQWVPRHKNAEADALVRAVVCAR